MAPSLEAAIVARSRVCLAVVALLGCDSVLGIEELPRPTDAPCATCAHARCASETAECGADATCAQVEACFAVCPPSDAVCHETCKRAAAPSGHAIVALETCRAAACPGECGLGCGGFAWASPYGSVEPCRSCMSASCCPLVNACATDAACQQATWCRDGAVTLDQFLTCRIDNLAGSQLADDVVGCAEDQCRTECGIGRNWSCVPAAWPEDSSPSLEFSFSLYELRLAQPPSEGFTVRACERSDLGCADPIAEGVTNAAGVVVFDFVAQDVGGFFKGFDHYMEVDVAATGYQPRLHQLSPPVTSAHNAQATAMAPADEFEQLAASVGTTIVPGRGHIALEVRDCSGVHAPDVQLSLEGSSAGVQPFYFDGFAPVPGAEATTTSGIGGLFNVEPGVVTVVGRVPPSGAIVGKVVGVIVRAGALTSTNFAPSAL